MPQYQKLGQMPRKHHIWFHRNAPPRPTRAKASPTSMSLPRKDSMRLTLIKDHLRPPTRVRNVEPDQVWDRKITDSPRVTT
jgi:hypothetical protein